MKRLDPRGELLSFQITIRERFLLLQALHRYPMLSAAHHRISHVQTPELAEAQKLLDEAIAEQHLTAKIRISELLTDGQCLKTTPHGCTLTVTSAQRELLLQCLNDIRIGCWIEIGSPEEEQRKAIPHTESNVKHLMLMDLCAYFQYGLIHGNNRE